ncbi:DUF3108 domain-containing protein [Azonexus sp.]|uniref:DUF3108 domain-containing protein n=1 Tax=Azonexus sp. TaxID=1872668 RepID=UPI0027B92496|nr:DUF3108 domain-containing protein [Azonexus sp.]
MPRVLLAALLGSLVIHAVLLFGTDFHWPDEVQEKQVIQATLLKPPPALPVAQVKPPAPVAAPAKLPVKQRRLKRAPEPSSDFRDPVGDVLAPQEIPESLPSTAEIAPNPPPVNRVLEPVLPSTGGLSFAVYKDSLGVPIGRAEHQWVFPGDGTYRLTSTMETSGLVSLFKPVRQVHESRGRLTVGGLQPEHFAVSKNGEASTENADFDWSTGEVRLARDGSVQAIAAGTQDMLSLHYQLAYLEKPEDGSTIGVVTGKRYERYALDSLGEEYIETPVRRFRTLHLRAAGETLTEIWIALDQQRLPVKIRFTDKKGDSYELRLTEIGADLPPSD